MAGNMESVKRQICLIICILFGLSPSVVLAGPASSNYELRQYSFGSGSTTPDTTNGTQRLFGNSGEIEGDPQSANYTLNGGAGGQSTTITPQTPTLTNPSQYYDRLKMVLDPGSDPSDTQYAIAISPDAFASTTQYVSASLTVIDTLTSSDWQTYAEWGGSGGGMITGLEVNTTYTIKVKSIQGDFSESLFSPTAEADTTEPSLTFSVSGPVDMGNLSQANDYTATANGTVTTSTNAFNGYNIYAYITNQLTMQGGTATIDNYTGTYASPSSWASGTGFGYTTNDTTINNVAKWNANPCPGDSGSPLCYAGFSMTGPGDVIADHEANLTSGPIVDEEFTISYKLVTTGDQPAGTYITTAVYTIAPIY
jgi:hypothetical protein